MDEGDLRLPHLQASGLSAGDRISTRKNHKRRVSTMDQVRQVLEDPAVDREFQTKKGP